MKIILTSETGVRLIPEPGPMTIEAQSVDQQYSPFHMLGSSLAFCTFSVMYSWATHVKLPVDDLTLDVSWEFADDPHRVGRMAISFDWPSLPEKRLNAAKRAAELCTIHATLSHSPTITIAAANEPVTAAAPRPEQGATRQADAPAAPAYRPMTAAAALRNRSGGARPRKEAPVERERMLAVTRDEERPRREVPPRPEAQGDGQESTARRPPRTSMGDE